MNQKRITNKKKIDRTKILQKGFETKYDFANFKTIRSFEDAIRSGIITKDIPNDKQSEASDDNQETQFN